MERTGIDDTSYVTHQLAIEQSNADSRIIAAALQVALADLANERARLVSSQKLESTHKIACTVLRAAAESGRIKEKCRILGRIAEEIDRDT
jgi:hypothetical protein